MLRHSRTPQHALHAKALHSPQLSTGALIVIRGCQVDAKQSQHKTYTHSIVECSWLHSCHANKHCEELCC